MMDLQTYYLSLATAAVLVLSPGPDTILVLSRTVASGAASGLLTLFGTQVGNVMHALLAGIGISTVIVMLPFAFNLLEAFGIAYLLYLAVQAWTASATLELDRSLRRNKSSAGRYFFQGLLNNLANPKMMVFFIALFPQFIQPGSGSLGMQSLLLGGTLAFMALIWIGLVVCLVGHFRSALVSKPGFIALANRLAAVVFAGLAVRLVFDRAN